MVDRQKSRELEKQASALLKGTPGLKTERSVVALVGISKREFLKNLAKRKTDALLSAYQNLPKAIRRALSSEYKALAPKPDWNTWLLTKADIVMGRTGSSKP